MTQLETDYTISNMVSAPGAAKGKGAPGKQPAPLPAGAGAAGMPSANSTGVMSNEMILKIEHFEKQVRAVNEKIMIMDT